MRASAPRRAPAALIASSVLVVVTVLLQAPGRIVPETKLDVLVDPVRYLGRALHAWDPSAAFGRVQNQAVGYLFPMGAFTTVGHSLGVPAWITQRLWIAAVILVALWGAHRLAGAVGIRSEGGRLVAAWAYAFAPATLATVAFQSAGQLPYSFAPWVLVPLVEGGWRDRPRTVAARSALFVVLMGGVNGASAFAVLPLVVIWFTVQEAGPARRKLAAWWAGCVALATLWWLIPLLVSVKYGVRFTAFTEQASLTTRTESATEILRGTGNWLSYLPIQLGSWLPGAHALAVGRVAIVGSVVVAAAGMAGLARRDTPGRSWLLPAGVLGMVAMGFAYSGRGGGSFGTLGQDLLDGPLAPFRNVHKFAAVVRLPLAIGLGHLVATFASAPSPAESSEPSVPTQAEEPSAQTVRAGRGARVGAVAAPVIALVAIAVTLTPAAHRLTAPGSFERIPPAWEETARWLDRHEGTSRALILPGSSFGEYAWGRPLDEPLASLVHGNWAIRDLIPLGGNGSTRLLDGIDSALVGDRLPVGFVPALQRAGVRYLVVRNDLELPRTGGPSPASMHRMLATAPELKRVASFRGDGGRSHAIGSDGRLAPDPRQVARPDAPEIEILEVPHPAGRVSTYPTDGAVVMSGGPEGLLQVPLSVTGDRAVVLAVDEPQSGLMKVERVATDTARRRNVLFGSIRNNASATLAPGEVAAVSGKPPEDRWAGDGPEMLTDARIDGAATITDDAPRTILLDPERGPGAAFDGNPATVWAPSRQDRPAPGRWLQVTFDKARVVPSVTVRVPAVLGERVATVRVDTDRGSHVGSVGTDGTARIALDHTPTKRVRLTIESVVSGVETLPLGLSEVELEGVPVRRSVQVAPTGRTAATRAADAVYLSRLRRGPFARYRGDEEGRLDRWVTTAKIDDARLSGTATAVPGPALDQLVRPRSSPKPGVTATASSRWHDQPVFDASSAVDGDPGTAWVSAAEVDSPALTLTWPQPVRVSHIHIAVPPSPPFDAFEAVTVLADGRRFDRQVDRQGNITIPAATTKTLTLGFPRQGGTAQRVVAVSEVQVRGADARTNRPSRRAEIRQRCGDGPDLTIDGKQVRTVATPTVGQLLDGSPVPWAACERVDLPAGEHHLDAGPSGALAVSTLSVEPTPGPALLSDGSSAPAPRTAHVRSWGREDRTVAVDAGPSTILATAENFNDGWEATAGGRTLQAIRVDGWRQGWIVPAGKATLVHLTYQPGTPQRIGLVIGALALVALLALAFVPVRRARATAAGATAAAATGSTGSAIDAEGRERPWPSWAALGLAALAGVALGGPMVLVLLPLLALPRRDRYLPWIAAAATVGAGVVAFIAPNAAISNHVGTLSFPAQTLATIAVLALAASAVDQAFDLGRRRRPAAATTPAAEAGSTPSSRGRSGRRPPRSDTTPEGSG
jgi:arabinofuranan 3-O-arabinosyltransferase